MSVRIEVAEVVSPTHRYNKAKVTLEVDSTEEGGPGAMVVTDRRAEVLLSVDGTATPDGRGAWTFVDSTTGVVYDVRMLSGCGCGGTTVDAL